MSGNPYAAPKANLESAGIEPAVPAAILKKIKNAWIAGIVSGCVTLAVTLLALAGNRVLGYSAWELLDVVLIFGLTFGIYKKSRTCALLLLVYFVVSKILLVLEGAGSTGIVMSLIFIYFYAQGVVGTFQYHKQSRP